MSIQDVIRAWKDVDYRESLSDAERAPLPAHPAGLIELSDADLGNVAGAATLQCTEITVRCSSCCI